MKSKTSMIIISVFILVAGLAGYRYTRLLSEYNQLLQIRSQEVPDFVQKIQGLESENSDLKKALQSYETQGSELEETRAVMDALTETSKAMTAQNQRLEELHGLDAFKEHFKGKLEDGFYWDLSFTGDERDRIDGYIKLWIQDPYFDETIVSDTLGDVTRLRVIARKRTDKELDEAYKQHSYLIDRYLHANMKIYDFVYGLKTKDLDIIKLAITEDDLSPDPGEIEDIIDAYKKVVSLNTLSIDLIGIGESAYLYKLHGISEKGSYEETVHLKVSDGILYISDYRGRAKWTGHH